MTRSQTATCLLYPPCTNHIVQIPQPCSASKTSSNKKFKAKHYSFSVLTIGKYKYKCDLQTSDRVARIKFLFSKRQLIYEYQVDLCSSLFTKKQMLEVVIPFHTICQIALENNEMKLELTHAPAMYKGIRGPLKTSTHNIINQTAQYNRRKLVDETNGQLSKCPFHCFKVACDSKIRSDLMAFHHSFKQMLQQQFVQDPTKTFRGMEVSICSNLLHPDIHLPTEQSNSRSFTEFTSRLAHNLDLPTTMCSCKEDCSHNKGCNCCLMGVKCTSGWCNCSKCQNPLNILQNMGCNKDKVTTDQCLMDNVYQICNRCYFAGESGVFKCSACVTSTVTKDEDGDTADEDLTADLTADDELSTDSTTE